ncbi:MAG: hypothetical protein ACPG7F_06990 [Aggregatilineales bacterium]
MSHISRRFLLKSLLLGTTSTLPGVSLLSQEAAPPVPRETFQCPILMYHYVSEAPADANRYLRNLVVSPELFAAHLDFLQADGFTDNHDGTNVAYDAQS